MAVMSATRRGKHQLLGQIGSPVQVKYGAEGKIKNKLDPVGSTVRYEMMKLCTGSV